MCQYGGAADQSLVIQKKEEGNNDVCVLHILHTKSREQSFNGNDEHF